MPDGSFREGERRSIFSVKLYNFDQFWLIIFEFIFILSQIRHIYRPDSIFTIYPSANAYIQKKSKKKQNAKINDKKPENVVREWLMNFLPMTYQTNNDDAKLIDGSIMMANVRLNLQDIVPTQGDLSSNVQ